MALYNAGHLLLADGGRLRWLDYQFPLKARRSGLGIGKVDLLGRTDDGRLCIVELKAERSGEDPRIALVEGLAYMAIVTANLERIAGEAEETCGIAMGRETPRLMLMAPAAYWANADRKGLSLAPLRTALEQALGLQIDCMLLDLARPQAAQPTPLSLPSAAIPAKSHRPEGETYLAGLRERFRAYQIERFAGLAHLFDRPFGEAERPPVFRTEHADRNVILPPDLPLARRDEILSLLPVGKRHRHFASFRSSQALTLAVFGSLKILGKLGALAGLAAEDGLPAFFTRHDGQDLRLEHEVTTLDEPRSTSIDVWLSGRTRVAIEAKFTEVGFGTCSRAELADGHRERCSGAYRAQSGRQHRCALTERGIRYWDFVPALFAWDGQRDHDPCPLRSTYQLARNVLAARVEATGANGDEAHALVVYDARNPAFRPGGPAERQWREAADALKDRRALRRLSWQRLLDHLTIDLELRPLVTEIDRKYGLCNRVT
jgi:hypothetical protein